ncbi:MAG: hypothetical protein F6J87_06135 [Spirulina sp. SIO3F2]|nr:hypothetical protein [Spirulina sp. SIO3F2]
MPLISSGSWRDKSAWEDFWQNATKTGQAGLTDTHVEKTYLPESPLLGYGYAKDAFLDNAHTQKRILFVGNGMSLKPLDYYFSGFDVTVLDISVAACELFKSRMIAVFKNVESFLQNVTLTSTGYQREYAESNRLNKFIYRPGGRIEVVCADMFDWQPKQTWNYIYNQLAFLPFSEEEQDFLLNRYYSWLEDHGGLQINYYFFPEHPFKRIVDVAKAIGFLVHDEDINEVFGKAMAYKSDPQKVKEIMKNYTIEEYKKELLRKDGRKMLWVIWGSVL